MELHLFSSTVTHAEAKQLRYQRLIPASKRIGLSAGGEKILAALSWQLSVEILECAKPEPYTGIGPFLSTRLTLTSTHLIKKKCSNSFINSTHYMYRSITQKISNATK